MAEPRPIPIVEQFLPMRQRPFLYEADGVPV
jgi:hypothetical protein